MILHLIPVKYNGVLIEKELYRGYNFTIYMLDFGI